MPGRSTPSMVMINLGNVITYRPILFLVGVDSRPMCLAHLLVKGDMVNSSILAEMCSCLFKVERNI